jgi:hypothetical protein
VLTAVEFDGELHLWTRKIDNPSPDGMLAPELPEDQALAQGMPEKSFNIGRLPA